MTNARSRKYSRSSNHSPRNWPITDEPEGIGKGFLQLIGNALLVQHRVSGRVAIGEKPDALWERPDLERLYARLEDEYELKERVDTLNRKLAVVAETADTLADIIDTRRSLRLELIVVVLIAFEIVVTFYQIYAAKGH